MIALIQSMSAQRGKEMREDAASRRLAARARRGRSRMGAGGDGAAIAIRRLHAPGLRGRGRARPTGP